MPNSLERAAEMKVFSEISEVVLTADVLVGSDTYRIEVLNNHVGLDKLDNPTLRFSVRYWKSENALIARDLGTIEGRRSAEELACCIMRPVHDLPCVRSATAEGAMSSALGWLAENRAM